MIVIFAGSIGRFPVGGHAWVDLQYLLGLEALGHDVFYVEDCGEESWVYDWEAQELTTGLAYPTEYLRSSLEGTGLERRWIYRAGGRSAGMEEAELLDACSRADLLIVRGVPIAPWRKEYDLPRRRAFVDSDPGFTQISLGQGSRDLTGTIARCERLFTVGQRIGDPDCLAPTGGRRWIKLMPPVHLPCWPRSEAEANRFTSILQWRSYREVFHDGIAYGNKDREFPKFLDLPRRTSQRFRLALTGAPPDAMREHGWEVVPGWNISFRPDDYRKFVQESRAELGIAKHGYVALRTGWFSDRSACYLASGRPVLLQETGLDERLKGGKGLVTFRDIEDALRGVESINADYEEHRKGARRLAEELLAAERVLPRFLEAAME